MSWTGAGAATPAAARIAANAATWRPPFHTPAYPVARVAPRVEWVISGLVLLAIVLMGTVSSTVLTLLKIHYLSPGGGFYEKFHPATYFVVFAFLLTLLRNSDPVGALDRMLSQTKLILVYLFSIALLFIHALVLERPATAAIDTFLLPALLCLVVWQLSPQEKRPLTWAIHGVVLLNVTLGYYEYFSGHRLVPLTVGDTLITGEWRSTALLGHPLTASALVAAYSLALILRPSLCLWVAMRFGLIVFCIGSLAVFGGRTALVAVLFVIAIIALRDCFRLVRGARVHLSLVIVMICAVSAVLAGLFALIDLGVVDKMLMRFSSDNGSALARLETLRLLTYFDWRELLLGPDPAHATSLQLMMGLKLGVENFWISCIIQYGIVHTVLLTVGLVCFFIEILRRSHPAAHVIVLFIVIIAASSVSFSTKNINLAEFLLLIVVLLPRDRIPVPQPRQRHVRVVTNRG